MWHNRIHSQVGLTRLGALCVVTALSACDGQDTLPADVSDNLDLGSPDGSDTSADIDNDVMSDVSEDPNGDVADDISNDVDQDPTEPFLPALRVVTFNTGTTDGLRHDGPPDDGYSSDDAAIADAYYGNGLAYPPVIADTAAWFASIEPDLIAFQEIFHPGECAEVPDEHHAGFICETWQDGDPTVAQSVLGEGFQVLCHPGKPDKCLAVRQTVGAVVGCDEPLCLDTLLGEPVPDCGSRVRVAYGDLALTSGPTIRVISVHGTSGLTEEDQSCRVAQLAQIRQAYTNAPEAIVATIVLGDFNTDPHRFNGSDASAAEWLAIAAETPLAFISPMGPDAPGAYGGFFDIDHVLSDEYTGNCVIPGVDADEPEVTESVYFDHHPVVCELAQ